jgi:hypothetical protein
MDEREKNLPKWAQEMLKELRLRCSANAEPSLGNWQHFGP